MTAAETLRELARLRDAWDCASDPYSTLTAERAFENGTWETDFAALADEVERLEKVKEAASILYAAAYGYDDDGPEAEGLRAALALRGAWVWRCAEVDELGIDEPRRALRDELMAFRRRWGLA